MGRRRDDDGVSRDGVAHWLALRPPSRPNHSVRASRIHAFVVRGDTRSWGEAVAGEQSR